MRKLSSVLVSIVVVAMASMAFAQNGAAPAPAPEVKATVDAFVGTWTFTGQVTGAPDAKGPIKVTEVFVCKKAGGGRVVACSGKATVAGMGKLEDEALIAYDEEGKVVRFVGMSSMGEVHDHRCTWKDAKTLTCEPLQVTVGGAPATVDLVATWSDRKNIAMTETTTMKDGSKMAFDGKGKRK